MSNVPSEEGYFLGQARLTELSVTTLESCGTGPVHMLGTVIEGLGRHSGDGFDVLPGMDVIGTGSLNVEGSGAFSFSF